MMPAGRLYLVPTWLDEDTPPEAVLPAPVLERVRALEHFVVENAKSARRFLAEMNKDCIVVKDSPGFVSNRVLMLTINEAIFLVHENVASAVKIASVDQRRAICLANRRIRRARRRPATPMRSRRQPRRSLR